MYVCIKRNNITQKSDSEEKKCKHVMYIIVILYF